MQDNLPTTYFQNGQYTSNPGASLTPTQNKPNFLERLLPTIGSAGLMTAGALLAPETGGASLLGSMALAGIGGGAGKAAENYATGQGLTKGVGGEIASNAIAGGVGGVVGKGLSGAAGLVGKGAEKAIAPLIVKQSGDMLDHQTAQYLEGVGLPSFKDAVDVGQKITGDPSGEGAALTKAVQNAADNSSAKIDLTDEGQNWAVPIENYPDVKGIPLQNISDTVNKVFTQAARDSGSNVTTVLQKGGQGVTALEPGALENITTGAALKASQVLRKAAGAVGNGAKDITGTVINSAKAAAQDTYNNLASAMEDKALGTDLSGNVAVPLSTADKETIKESLSNLQKSNPQLYADLSSKIDNANSLQDIRSAQQPFVKVSQANRAMEAKANVAPGIGASDIAAGTLGTTQGKAGLLKAAGGALLKSKTADTKMATTAAKLSSAAGSDTAKKLIPLLTKIGAVGANPANLVNMVPPPAPSSASTAASGVNPNVGGDVQQNDLTQLFNTVLAQASAPGAMSLPGYGSADQLLQALAPILQKQQIAGQVLQNQQGAYANAGGAQGTLGGAETDITGLIKGTPANTYNNQTAATSALLAQLLGGSAGAYQNMMPNFMQTQQTAAPQQANIQSLLAGLGQ